MFKVNVSFPNSNSFGVFSHSKGFGEELLSDSVWFSGADPSWGAKRFCGRFPHHFFELVSQILNSFLHFSRTALALECSAIVKVLGQNDAFVLLDSLQQIAKSPRKRFLGVFPKEFPKHWSKTVSCGSFGQMAVASEKVLWRVPPTVLYICLPVSSWGQRFVNC